MNKPQYWTSPDTRVAIKLNMQPGDHALVAGMSPEGTRMLGVFLYADGTVTIIGNQDKDTAILMCDKASMTLKAVPAISNLAPDSDQQKTS